MALRWAPLGLALPLFASGCVFSEPINRAPQARIVETSEGPYFDDTPISVSADKSKDPDGHEISLEWTARLCRDGACSEVESEQREPDEIDEPFEFVPGAKGRLEVILTVRDEPYGATTGDQLDFDILNRPPEVELQIQGHRLADGAYLIGRELAAVADAVDPDAGDEPVELSAELIPPFESDPTEVIWEEAPEEGRWHLVPDVSGQWEIEVEADDGDGGVDRASQGFYIGEDTPPCIRSTDPEAPGEGRYVLGVDEGERRFSVLSVEDELDPYPARPDVSDAGEAAFSWSLATPDSGGAFTQVSGRDAPAFALDPSEHGPGDELALRVEVSDRVERDIPCGEDQLTCSIGGNDCIQRTTWEVEIR